jgi:hypothetical protein
VGGEDSGDVFPEDPSGGLSGGGANSVNCVGEVNEREREVPALVVEGSAESCDGKGLARGAADEDIRGLDLSRSDARGDGGHVPEVRGVREVMGEHPRRERLDLG